MNRPIVFVMFAVVMMSMAAVGQEEPTTAREYYNELRNAHGLDGLVDEYVCFTPNDKTLFYLLAKSTDIDTDALGLTPQQKKEMGGDYLIIRGYDHGIPWKDRAIMDKDKDGDSYSTEIKGDNSYTERLTISWKTLRYKLSFEHPDGTELHIFWKCEKVHRGND